MKTKENKGIVLTDLIIALVAIIIFSTLIISMIYNNVIENVKLKKETLAMIYITEIFENIGIADFDDVIQDNAQIFIPEEIKNNVSILITDTFDGIVDNKKIMKKIIVSLNYEVKGKTYTCYMERLKVKV